LHGGQIPSTIELWIDPPSTRWKSICI
jgi:hypothetical protein